MSHGVLSPHWGWRNIRVGLDEEHAALLQTTFFRSEAFVEIHRDAYYGAAGLILVLAVLAILAYKLDIGNYRHLKDTARLTFLNHVIFFLVFLTTSIPYSVAVLRSFFAPLGPAYLLQLPTFRCISFPLGFQLVLYAYETAILISLFVHGFKPMSHTVRNSALYWVGLCMCTALSALQLYTFVIYRAIWQSTTAKTAMHSNAVPSGLKRPGKPDQGMNLKTQMVRSETTSSELPTGFGAPSLELTRSNLMATSSTNLGLYSSQTLLLDNILEDMPYNMKNSMVAQLADSKV